MGQVLTVSGLRVESRHGRDIVDEVSFAVDEGEILGIVGESGCGKTTTALALLGHAREGNRIVAGSVLVEGKDILMLDVAGLREMRGRRISYVAQDPTSSLSPRRRVGDQVAEGLIQHGQSQKDARHRVDEIFAHVELPHSREFLRRYPFELSGGQQQRVAIAMALAAKPRVVVLDEPTTGLDVTTQARVLELLRSLRNETGAAFVYVTHDLAVIDSLADRSVVMYAGRIVESAKQKQLFQQPSHPYTALLLGSVPRLAFRKDLAGIPGSAPPPGRRPDGCFFEPRCPLALDRCRNEFPPETSVAPGHVVRCWRSAELAPSISVRAPDGDTSGAVEEAELLSVAELTAGYKTSGATVLHGVSLFARRGECLALVGQSGSGKTTLGRCIVGLHRPESGQILLNGTPLARSVGERRQSERQAIQIVFQNPERSLNPSRTIESILSRPLELFGTGNGISRSERVAEVLEQIRLSPRLLHRFPREISGGEKQRVAIGRALVALPSVLISDEITSSLDVSTQAAIVSLLEELRQDGLAIVFITHNLALVNSIADRVVVLQEGEVREVGTTAQVIARPSHAYTRELLASAPDLKVGPG